MAVPFFSETYLQIKFKSANSLRITNQNVTVRSLQVPGYHPLKIIKNPEKRVLPCTSPDCARKEASLTLEAALGLSVFILAAAALMQPVKWLDRQRKIQTETERLCEDLSQYAYSFRKEEEGTEIPEEDQDASPYRNLFTGAAADLWLRYKIKSNAGTVRNLEIRRADVLNEKEQICFEVEYQEPVPFFHLSPGSVSVRAAAKRRAWTGIYGKLKKGGSGDGGGNGEENNKIVYVGENMGRYHWYRDCHYLSNQYQTVSAAQVGEIRNSSGRKYKPCASCAAKGAGTGAVYLTPEGEHYHTDKNCKAMIAYVRAVPLKEVEALGACSYCSRRKGGGA